MSTIEEAINTRLKAVAGLTALVGQRIYRQRPPQAPTYPLVTHMRETADPVSAMNADSGLEDSMFSVSIRAQTYADIVAVSQQVRVALQRFSGTVATVSIQAVYLQNETDGFDEDAGVSVRDMWFRVWFGE